MLFRSGLGIDLGLLRKEHEPWSALWSPLWRSLRRGRRRGRGLLGVCAGPDRQAEGTTRYSDPELLHDCRNLPVQCPMKKSLSREY